MPGAYLLALSPKTMASALALNPGHRRETSSLENDLISGIDGSAETSSLAKR
jgi:hypothetical protein